MSMTAIHTHTERKRQDGSARCAQKLRPRARTLRFPGLICAVPAVRPTAEAAWREKGLELDQIQAILTSIGMPLEECRVTNG